MYGKGRGGGGFGGQRSFSAPVKVGDELDVKIEAVGEKGDGIAKKNGFVLFVPGVKEGDEVRIKITKVLRRVGFAEVAGQASEAPEQEEEKPAEEATESPEEKPSEEEGSGEAQNTEDFGEEEKKEEEAEEEKKEE